MAEREIFVPESYDWGSEAQVDWYEAFAEVRQYQSTPLWRQERGICGCSGLTENNSPRLDSHGSDCQIPDSRTNIAEVFLRTDGDSCSPSGM